MANQQLKLPWPSTAGMGSFCAACYLTSAATKRGFAFDSRPLYSVINTLNHVLPPHLVALLYFFSPLPLPWN
ncbi:hypothetical protein BJY01DRAFT_229525 [Aspergillus pseudoustus]|uniref:Uncharacterized protein n=1 Tax=Aspergillus pseudoustus TaxID=1810923 RepID=A0ABR4IGN1_9EURO